MLVFKQKYNSRTKIEAAEGNPNTRGGLGRWADKENWPMPVTEQRETSRPLERSCCCCTLPVTACLSACSSFPSFSRSPPLIFLFSSKAKVGKQNHACPPRTRLETSQLKMEANYLQNEPVLEAAPPACTHSSPMILLSALCFRLGAQRGFDGKSLRHINSFI